MATFHGKGGNMIWSGTATEAQTILSWQLDASVDLAEITDMGDTWKTYLVGMKDWTATVEILAVDTSADLSMLGTTGTLTLTTTGGNTITGTAFCTGFSNSVEVSDAGKGSYTFQGSGALS